MKSCPRCLHGKLIDLKKSCPIIVCDYCGYRDYKFSNIHKYNNILLNRGYKFSIYSKKKIIRVALFFADLVYVGPMIVLYTIGLIFISVSLFELFPSIVSILSEKIPGEYFKSIFEIKFDILVTFFIMLGIVDLSILVLHRYVYKHISNLILDLNKLAPGYFSDSREIIIKNEEKNPNETKLYPERLLIFGIIIILLDIASKLFKDNGHDLKIILIGISMVLISIGIWKYLSFQADEFVEKSESKDKSDRNSE